MHYYAHLACSIIWTFSLLIFPLPNLFTYFSIFLCILGTFIIYLKYVGDKVVIQIDIDVDVDADVDADIEDMDIDDRDGDKDRGRDRDRDRDRSKYRYRYKYRCRCRYRYESWEEVFLTPVEWRRGDQGRGDSK